MVGTSCADFCGNAVELLAHVGPADPGWEYIAGDWRCPDCVRERWTPRSDLDTLNGRHYYVAPIEEGSRNGRCARPGCGRPIHHAQHLDPSSSWP